MENGASQRIDRVEGSMPFKLERPDMPHPPTKLRIRTRQRAARLIKIESSRMMNSAHRLQS